MPGNGMSDQGLDHSGVLVGVVRFGIVVMVRKFVVSFMRMILRACLMRAMAMIDQGEMTVGGEITVTKVTQLHAESLCPKDSDKRGQG
jgi:hypothetical protein